MSWCAHVVFDLSQLHRHSSCRARASASASRRIPIVVFHDRSVRGKETEQYSKLRKSLSPLDDRAPLYYNEPMAPLPPPTASTKTS